MANTLLRHSGQAKRSAEIHHRAQPWQDFARRWIPELRRFAACPE